ncbi:MULTISPECIES: Gfo/Idh/MocA family oxidoreductase [Mesorhizobium]|uniref:Gfo/Idh/MocA family protein n=1 Tax=Mesorhizobium TaxID=68287 RepID=UPI0007EE173F|nr:MULTISPECIES: Gfo/Idh/MocA family oxidoreductase [Mesorhizobium]PBB52933.1 gfo/Idh/MocA family oxidoreductase [Mesorhizobium loti]QIA22533.1 Gfo/Idh/MocA family oxidoreductase [Mesorhizobium sp. AA22]
MTKPGKLRWGLLGASNIAKEWLHTSISKHPDCEVVSVYSRDQQRAAAYAQDLGLQRYFTQISAFLADPELDAVYISTTNEKHRDEAIAAANAGKHILCEKPLALNVEDAQAMIDAAQAAGVVLATNHHLRNMETHRAIKDVIKSGQLGHITSARISFTVDLPDNLARWRLNDPKTGAGVVLDLTVHDMDLLRFYFDADPVSVTAMGLTSGSAPHGIKDNVMTIWEFPGRLLVSCHDTFLVPFGGTAIDVHGVSASVHGADVLWQKPQGRITVRDTEGTHEIRVEHLVPYDRTVADFVKAVRGTGEPSVTGEDGKKALRLALAAVQAMETGKTVHL